MSKSILPWAWWKLGWLWLSNLRERSASVRRGLFQTSLKVAVLSLSLGVGALSVTLAIVSGFEWTLGKSVSEAQGHVAHVLAKWQTREELDRYVSSMSSRYERAYLFWNSQGLVVGPKGGRGVLIEGRRLISSKDEVVTRNSDGDGAEVRVELGSALAQYLGVKDGESVKILLPGILKGSVEAKITKLISHGMYEIDSRLVLLDDASLHAYLQRVDPEALDERPGDGHGLRYFFAEDAVKTKSERDLKIWVDDYSKVINSLDPNDASSHRVLSWREQKASLFKGIAYNRKELSLILSLLTLVAALNVAATLVVLFLERDREMAIIQALGLSPRGLCQWIGIQGLMLGLISSGLGLLLGHVLGWTLQQLPFAKLPPDIYNLKALPLKFLPSEQLAVFIFGVLSALLVATFIGYRLSRVNLLGVLGQRR